MKRQTNGQCPLRPHTTSRATPKRDAARREAWERLFQQAYAVCYVVGVRSVRCVKSFMRFTRIIWRPIGYPLYRAVDWLILRHTRRLSTEWQFLRQDVARAGEQVQMARRKQFGQRVRKWLQLAVLAVRRHGVVFRTIGNLAAPVVALLLLVNTVMYWREADFALKLEYDGQEVGFIADESVYANAAAIVEGMVIDANDSFQVERAPKMTLTVAHGNRLLDEQDICNVILERVGDSVTHTTGLYVDGVFCGALAANPLEQIMQDVLQAYDAPDGAEVDFFPEITVKSGLYPVSAVRTAEAMRQYLETLPIQTVRYETHTEEMPYQTVVEKTTSQPLGYQLIKQHGVKGRQSVTEEIISVNGEERYRSVVSTETLKAPVPQIVVVGAQTYSQNVEQGDGKATGTFIWPLPYTKVISSPFASRWGSFHGAIDISNGRTHGKPIIASDGGVVLEAGTHGSYGYYVLIDHGNGFKTRYAHCSKLNVQAGQKVAQGEYIANVGNTGYSFGSHLHFEIIKNGKLVDPLKYVKR